MERLRDLGERAVIERLLEGQRSRALVGPGDDAAVLEWKGHVVACTDVVSMSGHAPAGMGLSDLGWMAAAVNFSDIAAMGARPEGLLTCMIAPPETGMDELSAVMSGVLECCREFDVELIGGDTKAGAELLVCGTALGSLEGPPLTRTGAMRGDLVADTGELGLAAAGFHAREMGTPFDEGDQALFRPWPRVREGIQIRDVASACMDTSDGLAVCLHRLRPPGEGIVVHSHQLPVHSLVNELSLAIGTPSLEMAMHFGGDYQLTFTLPPECSDLLDVIGATVIGEVVSTPGVTVDGRPLDDRGWEHFR